VTQYSGRDAEIAVEQKHVDVVYARVERMRAEAAAMRDRGDELAHGARNEAVFEQASMLFERDVMVRHANQILRVLDAEHEGLVFGRLDSVDGETMHVGRLGVRDEHFDNLVTDWRAPAAAPFYQATAEQPMDVVRRRVIRSSGQSVVDIDDDLLMPGQESPGMTVVGEGALMAALNRSRGDRMRDIVSTIQKEQDVAIRAPWRGVTEITGGPGTGKTAVALHRVAYLLYSERKRMGGAGVLVIGPSTAFTSYISRVLPSMGEDNVELRALGDVLDGVQATLPDLARVAAIKGSLRIRRLLKRAIRSAPYDAPKQLRITYRGEVIKLDDRELTAIRRAVHATGRPPNRSRVDAALAVLEALWRKADGYAVDQGTARPDRDSLINEVGDRIEFHRWLVTWWLVRTPAEVLRELGNRDALAEIVGRTMPRGDIEMLADSWARDGFSVADIALLDELRILLGEPPKRRRRRADAVDAVLARAELRTWTERQERPARHRPDNYDEYSHVVVDEAQDLSPMQWRMVGRRGRYASWTVVGDPVQSSWPDPAEAGAAQQAAFGPNATHRRYTLRTNYRNSAEIFALAARVVRDVATADQLPDAVRESGIEPTVRVVAGDSLRSTVVEATVDMLSKVDGTVGVIGATARTHELMSWLAEADHERLRVVDGLTAKGLEYDGVVLVEPDELITESSTGPRTLYVALTRATAQLTVLTTNPTWPD
jgi:RecA/RadA recombinase